MRVLLAAGLGVAAAIAATAAEIAPEARRSGYDFASPQTRAMQDDKAANPGMLWILQGETLWAKTGCSRRRACQDCHGEAQSSMKGVTARYPVLDASPGRPRSRAPNQPLPHRTSDSEPLDWESNDLLALTAFVAHQSRGLAIAGSTAPSCVFLDQGPTIPAARRPA